MFKIKNVCTNETIVGFNLKRTADSKPRLWSMNCKCSLRLHYIVLDKIYYVEKFDYTVCDKCLKEIESVYKNKIYKEV